jgi:GDSL-like Lipase/Acylhydrolase family
VPDLRTVALLAGGAFGLYLLFRPKGSTSAPSSATFRFVPVDQAGLIGDSLAAGLGPPLKKSLAEHDVTLTARGKGATITPGWLVFPELTEVLSKKPRAVFISLGTNDCHLDGRVCDGFEANMTKLVARLRDAGAVPILLMPPMMPWENNAEGASRMAKVRNVMQGLGGVAVVTTDVERAPDRIHLTGRGYGQWAQQLTEAFT